MGDSGLSAALIVNYCFCLWPIKPARCWENVANNIEAAPFTSGTSGTWPETDSPMLHKAWRSVVWSQGSGVFETKTVSGTNTAMSHKGARTVLHTHFVLQCVESSVAETQHWTNACSTSTCACTKRYHQKLC